ncbi:MAG: tRNA (guanine(10)-N(2))-dimethyltransferase [Candidatus Woesearchaeota archaeon]
MNQLLLEEGLARFYAPRAEIVSKQMGVFYNPAMKLNRDVTIEVLKALKLRSITACDLLAASGVRTIRMVKELPAETFKIIYANDADEDAFELIKRNLQLNLIQYDELKEWKRSEEVKGSVAVINSEANMLLNQSSGFDYIDIDPFGSPNPFLDSAVRRISRGGILAITATDTAPLSGTYEKTCLRKYWATPLRNAFMHETGLRILIRKAQLVAAQYGRALVPIFSYYNLHYFRAFLRCEKGKKKADSIIREHKILLHCPKCLKTEVSEQHSAKERCECGSELKIIGPLYVGAIWDGELLKNLKSLEIVETIKKEAEINVPFFYSIPELCSRLKTAAPKKSAIIEELRRIGFKASETHFDPEGMRTDASPEMIKEAIKNLEK